jgi:ribosomal protein L21E
MQNFPKRRHNFREGDRVEIIDRQDDPGLHPTHMAVQLAGLRGTVTWDKKDWKISVRLDDETNILIQPRHLRKLSELGLLAEVSDGEI